MHEQLKRRNALIISYLTLRKAIGILGTLFPFVLALGAMILFGSDLRHSVSHYYHSGMGDVFVGTLFAIGFFLFSYKGYDERRDDIAGDLGCLFALGTALFPTHPDPDVKGICGYIHLAFAALFFLTLIYFSLCLFTKTDPKKSPTRRKLQRNKIYKICGYTMSLCIVLIAVYYFFLPDTIVSAIAVCKPVFWLEAIAVVAFGISWLIKGETLLKDEA